MLPIKGLHLTASDTDISIQSFIPVENGEFVIAKVDKPGSVVLPAKFFVEIVKKLPSDEIEIEVKEHHQTSFAPDPRISKWSDLILRNFRSAND